MKLAYVAYDRHGREVSATMDAPSAGEATVTLRQKGLFVSQIAPDGEAKAVARSSARSVGRVKKRQVAGFMRQMYVLTSCSTPLVDALGALERQARTDAWRDTIADVRRRVEEGSPLSVAMEAHPSVFDDVARSLIAAGESTGNLSEMLSWLADMTQKQLRTRHLVIGAMIYPALLMTITIGVLALVILFVIPRFSGLFESLDVALPPSTAVLIALSGWLTQYWYVAGGATAVTVLSTCLWLRTPSGRRAWDTFILRLPKVGGLVRNFTTARLARLLGGLMQGNVPILDALDLSARSVRNCHYVALIKKAREAVTEGETLSSVFRQTDLINPSVYEAVHGGEQSGQIGPLLLHLADFLDEENEVTLRSLTSIIEPVILIVMGLLVGSVAMSLFLPLFDLTSMTQGS